MTERKPKKVQRSVKQNRSGSEQTVKLRQVGKRLDQFLTEFLAPLSRGVIQRGIIEGRARVNGETTLRATVRLRLGDRVEWQRRRSESTKVATQVESAPFSQVKVLAENDDFLVLAKPAGLSMHPVRSGQKGTLSEWLYTRYPQIQSIGDNPLRPGMVHRLDKDTSGLVLIAKQQSAFMALKSLFQAREVKKTYLALVYGQLNPPSGVIDEPLGRLKGSIRRATAGPKREFGGELREALTEYTLHTRFVGYDFLSVQPKTGRTHQIRVHLASLGHPIVGDRLYRFKTHRQDPLDPPHQLLHAARIDFTLRGKRFRFEAPLPDYFADTLSILALKQEKSA